MRLEPARGRYALAGALAVVLAVPAVQAEAEPCVPAGIPSLRELVLCITVPEVGEHLAALSSIAAANGGTRASGTPGYEASAEYAADILTAAGYVVTVTAFEFPFFQELVPPGFARIAPTPRAYVAGTEFVTVEFSAGGAITADVASVDIVLPPGPTPDSSTSGCDATDFAAFPTGGIALVQRGGCPLAQKVVNAETAGALAVIIFNEGQPGRTELLRATLEAPVATIPVVGTSFAVGAELAALAAVGAVTVSIAVDAISEVRSTENVLAETVDGFTAEVVMAGAHLDSALGSPGMQDNASGAAVLLELAEQLGRAAPDNRIRFALWGAGERGFAGASAYLASLSEAEHAAIGAYINVDNVGSSNFARFVYDGDGDLTGMPGPDGSDDIETIIEKVFRRLGLDTDPVALTLPSDHLPFVAAGIAVGGVFAGADGLKTPAEAADYGGTAGAPYDPCYHQACDTLANVSEVVLGQMAQAVAATVYQLAVSIERIDETERTALRTGASTRGSAFLRGTVPGAPVAA